MLWGLQLNGDLPTPHTCLFIFPLLFALSFPPFSSITLSTRRTHEPEPIPSSAWSHDTWKPIGGCKFSSNTFDLRFRFGIPKSINLLPPDGYDEQEALQWYPCWASLPIARQDCNYKRNSARDWEFRPVFVSPVQGRCMMHWMTACPLLSRCLNKVAAECPWLFAEEGCPRWPAVQRHHSEAARSTNHLIDSQIHWTAPYCWQWIALSFRALEPIFSPVVFQSHALWALEDRNAPKCQPCLLTCQLKSVWSDSIHYRGQSPQTMEQSPRCCGNVTKSGWPDRTLACISRITSSTSWPVHSLHTWRLRAKDSPAFRALDTHDLWGLPATGANRTLACILRSQHARSPQRVGPRQTSSTLACISRTRHARSPQRVARDKAKSHSRLHFAPSTRTIRRGLAATKPSGQLRRHMSCHTKLERRPEGWYASVFSACAI